MKSKIKVLHFTADWCSPCKKIKPVLEEFAKNNKDIDYIQIDVDNDLITPNDYGVSSIPTIIVIENNIEQARRTGIIRPQDLHRLVYEKRQSEV